MLFFRKSDFLPIAVLLGCGVGVAFAAQVNERVRTTTSVEHLPVGDIPRQQAVDLLAGMCTEISESSYENLTIEQHRDVVGLIDSVCSSAFSAGDWLPKEKPQELVFSNAI